MSALKGIGFGGIGLPGHIGGLHSLKRTCLKKAELAHRAPDHRNGCFQVRPLGIVVSCHEEV